jgi:hypothetical protein
MFVGPLKLHKLTICQPQNIWLVVNGIIGTTLNLWYACRIVLILWEKWYMCMSCTDRRHCSKTQLLGVILLNKRKDYWHMSDTIVDFLSLTSDPTYTAWWISRIHTWYFRSTGKCSTLMKSSKILLHASIKVSSWTELLSWAVWANTSLVFGINNSSDFNMLLFLYVSV